MRDRVRRLLSFGSILAASFVLQVCQGAPPPRTAPQTRQSPRRVVLLSLDGASAEMLHQLHKEGALTAGGFESFFRNGQVAGRLLPVNPTLTAVNHISLITGYPPAQTGIVNNSFHPAGAPFLDLVSGFSAPIATETLWEAAKRQGKRVGVMTWPGADAKVPRRTGDWGMVWLNEPERASSVVTLKRSDWSTMPPGPATEGIESYSPLLRGRAAVGPEGQAGRELEILAVDRTDDHRENYDTLVPLAPGDRVSLQAGQWARLPCQSTFCWIKLLSLDPDLGTAQIYFNAVYHVQAYPEAFENGLASLLWTGQPDEHFLEESWKGRPGIDLATWTEQADRFTAFLGDTLRAAAGRTDWDLLLGYISSIDDAGHVLTLTDPAQPGYSTERRDAFAAARRKVWQAVDRELAAFLKTVDLRTTAVVVVSDHGMAPIHTVIDPNVLLRDKGVLTVGADGKIAAGTRAYSVPAGGMDEIYVDPAAPDRERLITGLKSYFSGWTTEGKRPIVRVLTRHEAAGLGIDHPDSGDLILAAATGYAFTRSGLKSGRALAPTELYGMHGYPNTDPRMAGIYMALGAGVKPGKAGTAGTVRNTDVAGQVARWLGIEKPRVKPE